MVERSGGFVAKYMGDGVLAYFGYPLWGAKISMALRFLRPTGVSLRSHPL
jgi:class 3 adenylate cyclase